MKSLDSGGCYSEETERSGSSSSDDTGMSFVQSLCIRVDRFTFFTSSFVCKRFVACKIPMQFESVLISSILTVLTFVHRSAIPGEPFSRQVPAPFCYVA